MEELLFSSLLLGNNIDFVHSVSVKPYCYELKNNYVRPISET